MRTEKNNVPTFPKNGGMTNLLYTPCPYSVVAGCFGDELEVKWLREGWTKSCGDLESSDMKDDVDYLSDGIALNLRSRVHCKE